MTLGQKLKTIRKRFGLTQEELAEIMRVSRQAITKWESDAGLPDVSNLSELAKTFNISIDSLLNDSELPILIMTKELDKDKYTNKLSSYSEILKEYYSDADIYTLTREKKMNFIEFMIDIFVGGSTPEMIYPIETADVLSDLSPYYLIIKDGMKYLVNIKEWTLKVIVLPDNTNTKKFVYEKNLFRNCGKLKFK